MKLLWALIAKDLKIFFSDRKAMLISLAVPTTLACFLALVFGGASASKRPQEIPLLVVDQDRSPITQAIVQRLEGGDMIAPKGIDFNGAIAAVKKGDSALAVVFPKGFGEQAKAALTGGPKPVMRLLYDPSQTIQMQAVNGALIQTTMQTVAEKAFGGGQASLPFDQKQEPQQAQKSELDSYSGVAHSFAGMGVQGLLFWSVEAAMGMMRERKQGIWKRQRATPVSPLLLLLGRLLSTTIRALAVLSVVFLAGGLLFHLRIQGSIVGFVLIALSASLMAASIGLFVAALGRTEEQSRGLSVLFILMMLMLGGAWFPLFLMPKWVQNLALAVPVRWAVDGFDSMTWRGGDLSMALPRVVVLLGFALLFSFIALRRFRWEGEAG